MLAFIRIPVTITRSIISILQNIGNCRHHSTGDCFDPIIHRLCLNRIFFNSKTLFLLKAIWSWEWMLDWLEVVCNFIIRLLQHKQYHHISVFYFPLIGLSNDLLQNNSYGESTLCLRYLARFDRILNLSPLMFYSVDSFCFICDEWSCRVWYVAEFRAVSPGTLESIWTLPKALNATKYFSWKVTRKFFVSTLS